jgi:hypothetical protein
MVERIANIDTNAERFAKSFKKLIENRESGRRPAFGTLPLRIIYFGHLILRRLPFLT